MPFLSFISNITIFNWLWYFMKFSENGFSGAANEVKVNDVEIMMNEWFVYLSFDSRLNFEGGLLEQSFWSNVVKWANF